MSNYYVQLQLYVVTACYCSWNSV